MKADLYLGKILEEIPYEAQRNSNYQGLINARKEGDLKSSVSFLWELLYQESVEDRKAWWIWNHLRVVCEILNYNDKLEMTKLFIEALCIKSMGKNYSRLGNDLLVELDLLPTQNGGRSTALYEGFTEVFKYCDQYFSAMFKFSSDKIYYPGDQMSATVGFKFSKEAKGFIQSEGKFELGIGSRIIGSGTIIEVLNSSLLRNHR